MSWRQNLKRIDEQEKTAIRENKDDVEAANARMLRVILAIGVAAFTSLLGLSFVLKSYAPLRVPYAVLLISMLAIVLLSHLPAMRAPVVLWLYSTFIVYAADAMLCGIFVTPGYVGVLILACIFQLPVLTLDRSERIDLVTLLIAAAYLLLVVPHKDAIIQQDEILNVFFFTAISLTSGGFLRRTRLNNFELERQSVLRETTDYLTGLGNRRQLFDYLSEKEKPDCPAPITGMLMLDIDNFKLYNDSYGHIAGDECLRRLGACLQNLAQSYPARFFRYGGEEFLAASSEFSREEMYCFCEKIADEVRHMNIQNEAVEKGRVTVSIGFTVEESPVSRKYEQMISRADSALYEAKRTGRDRVVGCR